MMFGYVEWTEEKGRGGVRCGRRQILHLQFFAAALLRRERTPEALVRLRCRAAARRMQKLGISQAVFPEQFAFLEEFARRGIRPADPTGLYRALSAELVRAALAGRKLSPAGAVVAFSGEHLTAELARAVTEACIRSRYVTLSVRGEGAALCRQLRREYGAALVQTDDPEQLARADVRVLFAPRPDLSGGENTLELYAGGACPPYPLHLAGEGETEIPAGCSRSQLFAALCAAGALRPGQIEAGNFAGA